jgi:pimeloyl-ACP methyl ester carboxylesterase
MDKRMIRRVVLVLVAGAFIGYRHWQDTHPAGSGGDGTPAAAAADATAPASVTADNTRRYGKLAFATCTLASPVVGMSVPARCARLDVPEDPQRPGGRRIGLKIAWLEAEGDGPVAPDPVFFIAGGPGQSATESAPIVAQALREVRKQRDVFLVDQRGTGGSNALACDGADGKPLAFDENATDPAAIADYARRCAAALAGRADPRYYTTTEAVGDLDAVRAALGVEAIDLAGVSYGTRVAQQYARLHGQHVRAMVLDGVAPNDLVVGGEFADTFEDAIALQAAQCQGEPACARRFPVDTREQLRSVVEHLRRAPVPVEYRDAATNALLHDTVTADTVTGLAFAFSYAPQSAALLPLMLDEAAQGRYGPLMSVAQMATREFSGSMNRAMQWSVVCAEDADRYRPRPGDAHTLLGPEVASMFYAACPGWPTGTRPAGFTEPLHSDVPALLLSGQMDPVTPPRYAARVLAGLPRGRGIVAPGQGHGVMGLGCLPRLMAQFYESADARALDTRCVQALTPVPAFTSFNGWQP